MPVNFCAGRRLQGLPGRSPAPTPKGRPVPEVVSRILQTINTVAKLEGVLAAGVSGARTAGMYLSAFWPGYKGVGA